ncbi:hypothetical protein AAER02_19610, partial [Pseudomonas aeruginosa]
RKIGSRRIELLDTRVSTVGDVNVSSGSIDGDSSWGVEFSGGRASPAKLAKKFPGEVKFLHEIIL